LGSEGNNGHTGPATIAFVASVPLVIITDAVIAFDEREVPKPPPPIALVPVVGPRGVALVGSF
jgi:hypothetical protein